MSPNGRGLCAALGAAIVIGLGGAVPEKPLDASIGFLRLAVTPRQDQHHLNILSSLRQLRDPTLRSFFLQLAQDGDAMSRIHAILGLAEIEDDGRIDPWLVSQLETTLARFTVIDSAVQLDLIDTPQIKELLGWGDLEPKARALLMAELFTRREPLDREAVAELAAHEKADVAGLAACLAAQLGDVASFEAWRDRALLLPEAERDLLLRDVFAAAEIYELTAVLDWIASTVQEEDVNLAVAAEGVATLLALDPQRGASLWKSALGEDPSYRNALQFGLMALATGPDVPAELYDGLPDGDPLLDAMANAGRAISTGQDAASAMIELANVGHMATTSWVMKTARELDEDQAIRVYTHLIDRVEADNPVERARRSEVAFIAAAHLFEISPEAVLDRLDRAQDNSLTQQALLMGLLESRSPSAGTAARQVDRIGFGLTDSLALLLVAKHAETLTDAEKRQLGVVASGGGRLAPSLQAQAAWLYLKHDGAIEQGLVEIFSTDEPQ